MTMAVGVFAVSFNAFGAKRLPLFEGLILSFFILGFFAIVIPLWILAPKATASEVFGSFSNFGGWSTTGAACIVGQMAASAAFIVSFCAAPSAVRTCTLTCFPGCGQRRTHV